MGKCFYVSSIVYTFWVCCELEFWYTLKYACLCMCVFVLRCVCVYPCACVKPSVRVNLFQCAFHNFTMHLCVIIFASASTCASVSVFASQVSVYPFLHARMHMAYTHVRYTLMFAFYFHWQVCLRMDVNLIILRK